MRNAFAQILLSLAEHDPDLVLLYADIGNRLFNPLKELAPDRCINTGIAEAHMASMSAGLALAGMRPVLFTITPFTTSRNFEQIKVDIAYQNLPVVIAGTGSGLCYANLGPTHHSFEDIALMRSLPNMTVICPADKNELAALLPKAIKTNGPVYVRMGKKNEPVITPENLILEIGKVHVLRAGAKIAILANGLITAEALTVCDALQNDFDLRPELVSFHTVKPLDVGYLKDAVSRFDYIVTLEEHSLNGGFGSAIAEWCIDNQMSIPVLRLGIKDCFIDQVSSRRSALEKAGLGVEAIKKSILEFIAK